MKIIFRSYLELTKPGISRMQLVSVAIGFVLTGMSPFEYVKLFFALLLATYLVASAAGVFNHIFEHEADSLMHRTKNRPLPSGKVKLASAAVFGLLLLFIGGFLFLFFVNLLTLFLGLLTVFLYLAVYTPLKRRTWLNTFFGAIPGAIPILMGWSAATGALSIKAWALFLVLFTWQHPHFYALAMMYKDDYQKGGFQMLPVIDQTGNVTNRQFVFYTALMIFSSLLPYFFRYVGLIYLVGVVVLGSVFFILVLQLVKNPTHIAARRLFLGSVFYLPLWFLFIVFDFIFAAIHP